MSQGSQVLPVSLSVKVGSLNIGSELVTAVAMEYEDSQSAGSGQGVTDCWTPASPSTPSVALNVHGINNPDVGQSADESVERGAAWGGTAY
jgi:hypothetical protein